MAVALTESDVWTHLARGAPDECWEWTGHRHPQGYGQILERGGARRYLRAHRVVYELLVGPIPDGLFILHSCDNPPCCNPAHLRPGTNAENMADKVARGRLVLISGERNGRSKLSEDDVQAIRAELAAGASQRSQATRFGVHRSQIGRIARGERWKSLSE